MSKYESSLNFKYKDFEIIVYENKIKYKKRYSNKYQILTYKELDSVIMHSSPNQLYFNGLNIEVCNYIKRIYPDICK